MQLEIKKLCKLGLGASEEWNILFYKDAEKERSSIDEGTKLPWKNHGSM